MKKSIVMYLGVLLLLYSCTSLREHPENLPPPPIYPIPDLLKDGDKFVFNVLFRTTGDFIDSGYNFYQTIRTVHIETWDENKNFISEIKFDTITTHGIPAANARTHTTAFGESSILQSSLKAPEGLTYWVVISDTANKYAMRFPFYEIAMRGRGVLEMYPVVYSISKDEIEFGLLTIRKRKVEEYIPNSEILRVDIFNREGKPFFNSAQGKNFMQVIEPVYPERMGGYYDYKFTWNYKDNSGNKVPPGNYTINMTIPADPAPYSWEFNLIVE